MESDKLYLIKVTLVDSKGDQFPYIQYVFTNSEVIEEEIINKEEQVDENAVVKAEETDNNDAENGSNNENESQASTN